ncbi:hypothetical protein [Marinicauda salina]|nr:hypothetical protein [Marinicauda salina]
MAIGTLGRPVFYWQSRQDHDADCAVNEAGEPDAANYWRTRISTDAYGRDAVTTYPHGGRDWTALDANGNVVERRRYTDADTSPQLVFTHTFSYDALNRQTQMVTPEGTWTYEYDLTGARTRAVFDPAAAGEGLHIMRVLGAARLRATGFHVMRVLGAARLRATRANSSLPIHSPTTP